MALPEEPLTEDPLGDLIRLADRLREPVQTEQTVADDQARVQRIMQCIEEEEAAVSRQQETA
jgi:hypothetical protein